MSNIVQIKVIPNARQNEIIGVDHGILKVRIKGVPEKGKVNEELIQFLAKILKIAKSDIEILSGHTSRLKKVRISKNFRGVDDFGPF